MNRRFLAAAAVIAALAPGSRARADQVTFEFSGAGVSGSGTLTVTPDRVMGDPGGAYTITGISGTFSDSNLSPAYVNEAITGLVAISPINPPMGAPYPVSMSLFAATNLPPTDSAISYDNLFYPVGSPDVCPGYPGAGGFLDIYGVLFTLQNGSVVDLWSNGAIPHGPPLDYGVAVMNAADRVVDFQSGGVTAVPEPGSLGTLVIGLFGALAWRKRRAIPARRPASSGR